MTNRSQIILSQLTPPAQRANVLARQRVNHILELSLNHALTILTAGTGYGKTTSILTFIQQRKEPVFWFSTSRNERDPRLFLSSLYTAFNQIGGPVTVSGSSSQKFGQPALRLLDDPEADLQDSLLALTNALCAELRRPAFLILDDFHNLQGISEIEELMDWFIKHIPRNLHVIIATRTPISLPSLNRWRVRGLVLELKHDTLSFTEDEVSDLFNQTYQYALPPEDIIRLHDQTEGWAIGLQIVWQSLKELSGVEIDSLLKGEKHATLDNLFAYLAEEVLDNQPEDIHSFLVRSSILRFLESDVCDFLLDIQDSQEILSSLYHSGLFLEQLKPGVYRFHHMFRNFLLNHLDKTPGLKRELHRKIASYFIAHEYWERAIAHLLSAEDYPRVKQVLDDVGDKLLQSGLYHSLSFWLHQLPKEELESYAYGNYLMGEVCRYEESFDQALEYYRSAQRLYQSRNNAWGMSQALRGQSQVYLDTIRPVNANQLLARALELLNPQEHPSEAAGLLTQIAENQINQGEARNASCSLKKAEAIAGTPPENHAIISARLLLRTGQLDKGIALLEAIDPSTDNLHFTRPQRFHRETSLLLSLFYALKGDAELAKFHALKGAEIAAKLHSGFVNNVSKVRLGHALQLDQSANFDPAHFERNRNLYLEAIENADIVRIHVEPLWGLCRLLGFHGDLHGAEEVAQNALSIAQSAGDTWIGLLARISLGASQALAGETSKASEGLAIAESLAIELEDVFCRAAVLLWEAYVANQQGYKNSMLLFLDQALEIAEREGFDFLFLRPSLLGSGDPFTFLPLLLKARENEIRLPYVLKLLREQKAESLSYHPGCQLRIHLLGQFEVWQGGKKLSNDVWKREKARQLLQILSVDQKRGMSKEQICSILWPEADSATANNNLKVVLNALNQALEPDRPSGAQPLYVVRRDDLYLLNPELRTMVDIEYFEKLCLSSDLAENESAFAIYRGHLLESEWLQEAFLADAAYYHRLYLTCAAKVIESALEANEAERALELSDRLLQMDPQYEGAYQLQMRSYHALGNTAMVRKVYHQAAKMSQQIYGSESLSKETETLFQELLG